MPSYIVLLQPTSPFVSPEDIDKAFTSFCDNAKAVVSVCESGVFLDWLRQIRTDGWLEPVVGLKLGREHKSRQKMNPIYRVNGAIYWIKTSVFLEMETLFPDHTKPFIMPRNRSIDIDNDYDLQLARWLVSNSMHE